MEEIIERLWKEKNEIEEEYYVMGKKAGREWCENAHYKEIHILMGWDGETMPRNEVIRELIDEAIDEDDLMGYFGCNPMAPFNDFALPYFIGFSEGVKKFWQMIEPELD